MKKEHHTICVVLLSFNLLSLNTLISRGCLRYSRDLVGSQLLLDDNAHRLLKKTVGGSLLDGFAPRSAERHGDRSVSRAFGFHHKQDGRFGYFERDLHCRQSPEVRSRSLGYHV